MLSDVDMIVIQMSLKLFINARQKEMHKGRKCK